MRWNSLVITGGEQKQSNGTLNSISIIAEQGIFKKNILNATQFQEQRECEIMIQIYRKRTENAQNVGRNNPVTVC